MDESDRLLDLDRRIESNAKSIAALTDAVQELGTKLGQTLDGVRAISAIRAESLHELQVLRADVDTLTTLARENLSILHQLQEGQNESNEH